MNLTDSTLWWVAAGALVAMEMAVGTFYLLMLAIGAAAGALAAYMGFSLESQLVAAALVGGLAVLACYMARRRRQGDPPARALRSVNLDIGETVEIGAWNADGTARLRYRGTDWTAVAAPGIPPLPGPHRVVELVGSRLVVAPA